MKELCRGDKVQVRRFLVKESNIEVIEEIVYVGENAKKLEVFGYLIEGDTYIYRRDRVFPIERNPEE